MPQVKQAAPRTRLLLLLLLLLNILRGARAYGKVFFLDATQTMIENVIFGISEEQKKKFGDKCSSTDECGFEGSVCDDLSGKCICRPEFPATNHLDKCGVGKFCFPTFYESFTVICCW